MTTSGRFFAKRSINRSDVSRKTGISKTRLSELANNLNTQSKVKALYLIALAIDEDPCELFKEVCKDYKLPEERYSRSYKLGGARSLLYNL